MLLAADANGFDFGSHSSGLTQGPADAAGGGLAPGMGMLFLGPRGQSGD